MCGNVLGSGQNNRKSSGHQIQTVRVLPQIERRGDGNAVMEKAGCNHEQYSKKLHDKACEKIKSDGKQHSVSLEKLPQSDTEIDLYHRGEGKQQRKQEKPRCVNAQ